MFALLLLSLRLPPLVLLLLWPLLVLLLPVLVLRPVKAAVPTAVL